MIGSQNNFKSVKSTWAKEAINIDMPTAELLKAIEENRLIKEIEQDKSKIGKIARDLKFGDGKIVTLAELEYSKKEHIAGIRMLTRLRTGTYTWTRDMARLGRLPEHYISRCVCCDKVVQEDIEHILIDCERIKLIRDKHFPKLEEQIAHSRDKAALKKQFLNKLLGGETPTSGRKRVGQMKKTLLYLAEVSRHRGMVLSNRLS